MTTAGALIAKAYAARTAKTRIKHARAAIATDPDRIEAYLLLGEALAESQERRAILAEGAARARVQWAPQIARPDDSHFWLDHDTRPFMRILHLLAIEYWNDGDADAAITGGEELLRLNPNDNQGIRDLLADWYGAMNRWDDCAALLARYPEDWSTSHHYTRWLLAFRSGEDTAPALADALAVNPHVPAFLSDPLRQPDDTDDNPWSAMGYVTVGSPGEAHDYAAMAGTAWANVPGAMERLARDAVAAHDDG